MSSLGGCTRRCGAKSCESGSLRKTCRGQKLIEQIDRAIQVNDHQLLTARQVTDIVILDIPQLANSEPAMATTLAHGLRLAGTQLLNLDSRELGSFVMQTDAGPHCGLVLFDSVPGGAGHVAELLESADAWFQKTSDALFVSKAHHERCVSACLDCLLSFETQFDHDAGLLARADSCEFWNCLRSNQPWSSSSAQLMSQIPVEAQSSDDAATAPSDADRLGRARDKRRI